MKFIRILFFEFAFFINFFAQENKLKFDFDYALFKHDDSTAHLELYYSLYQPSMAKMQKGNSIVTRARLDVILINPKNNEVISSKGGNIEAVYDSNGDKQSLLGKLDFFIPYGKYNLSVSAIDVMDSTSKFNSSITFAADEFSKEKISLSDIQLANRIIQSTDEQSVFYKNALDVEPNPSNVFSYKYPVVFYYIEYYNIQNDFVANYILQNSFGKVVFSKSKKVLKNENSIVDVGTININEFPSGIYTLIARVNDNKIANEKSKKFFIYNPNKLDTINAQNSNPELMQNEFIGLSVDELNLIFKKSEYVSSEREKKEWDKLTELQAKQKFLSEFWKSKDENPSTPINETKIGYFERLDYAQKKFTTLSQREGWKTDRGRVYITYGKPSEIERYPNESETKPYEIWRYENIEGGVIFIFADLTGYSDYRLIHSTKRGELYFPDWQKQIKQ